MKMKPLSILGVTALLVTFSLNLKNSFDDYGFLKNSFIGEIFAQSNSSGGSGTGGGSSDGGSTGTFAPRICESVTVAHDWTTKKCSSVVSGGSENVFVVDWSSYTRKCDLPPTPNGGICENGNVTDTYVYSVSCTKMYSNTNSSNLKVLSCPKAKP